MAGMGRRAGLVLVGAVCALVALAGGTVDQRVATQPAEASYLSLPQCRAALTGAWGSDNDVRRERRRYHPLRVGWGRSLRIDGAHVIQMLNMRMRDGRLLYLGFACADRPLAIDDWVWQRP
jgi:hypothetical protein